MSEQSNDIVEVLLDQHGQIRQLLEEVEQASSPEARRGPFEALVRLLAVHEAAEEQVLHPVARLRLPHGDEDRQTLGQAFKAAELLSPTHPHPRDPNRPPANVMVGPMVAVADHVRDALRSAMDGLKRAG